MKVWTIIYNNGFGEGAFATANGMKMTISGNYAGYLNPEQVNELRESGYRYKLHFDNYIVD